MKKYLVFLTINILFLCSNLFSQTTTTIDYSSANFGTNCNVFASPVTYQEHVHQTSLGFPYFSSADGAIVLQSKPISTSNQGATQYAIAYPFKQGFTYQIKLYGKSTLGGTNALLPSAALELSTTNGGTNSSTNCSGPASVAVGYDGTYGHVAFTTAWSWSGNLFNGVASQNYSYLLIAAFPAGGTSGTDQTISLSFIRKIQITEIPNFSFTLSPTSIPKTCGTALNQTFTETGHNIPQGASVSYIWNLGSVSNGWIYNGTAAPQTITTSSNTLILSAGACGIKPNNVSLSALVNGTTVNGGTAVVSMPAPAFDISGPSSVCSTSQPYSITNLNCSGTINWSVIPSNIASLSCTSCSQPTLTVASGGGGIISATISSACTSSPVTISKAITVGVANNYYISNIYVYPNPPQIDVYTSSTGGPQIVTSWSIAVDGVVSRSDYGYPPAITVANGGTSCGTHTVTLTTYNNCGSYSVNSQFSRYSGCYGYTLAPNPANSAVTITSTAPSNNKIMKTNKPVEIIIFDQANRPLKHFSFSKNSEYHVSLTGLLPGAYTVQIKDGDNVDNLKLIKQ